MKKQPITHQRFWQTEWLQLIVITVVALVLRTYHLQTLPAALNRDEAALGYNAWLLQTMGVDEWGERWPVALKSFGDYKLPGYPLLTIGSFMLFGRSDAAVRLPSALAGSLLPLAVWYLLKQARFNGRVRLVAAWLIAIAPFSIFYSRMGFEASVALTVFTVALALVIKTQLNRTISWQTGLLLTGLVLIGIFTYNTPLLLTPFVIGGLLLYGIGRSWKPVISTVVVLLIPLLIGGMLLWQLSQQKAGISIFTDPTITSQLSEQYAAADSLTERLLANRLLRYSGMMLKNVVASWSPQFLVTHGGSHPWHTIPQAAHLTWYHYLLGLLGMLTVIGELVTVLRQHLPWSDSLRTKLFLGWMLLAGLAPAAVTVDAPHATRSLLFLLLWVVFAALGTDWLLHWIERRQPALTKLTQALLLSAAVLASSWYIYLYFHQYPTTQAMFQPGLATVLPPLASSTKPILVTGDGYTYISLAWYQPILPSEFLNTIERHPVDTIGFAAGKTVGHYTVRPDFKTPEATQAGLLFWQDNRWQTAQLP